MTPRNLLVAIVAVAIVAAALTFLLYEPSTAIAQVDAPPRAADAQPAPTVAEAADGQIATETAAPAPAEPQRTAAEPTAAPAPGPLAHIVGRCVDAAGAPLAGCKIDLDGWNANSERVDAWRVDHDEDPPWKDPEDLVTGDDGRFAFAFWPPPPFQFSLDVTKEACGHLNGRWSKLDEGQTLDVGDVVVTAGVKVHGRVVDKQGAPLAKAYLSISSDDRGGIGDGVGPVWGTQVVTKDDGAFVTRGWLVPGKYDLRVQDRDIESEKQVELVAERPEEVLTVVVADQKEQQTITGRVVDEAGAPVARVQVTAFGNGWSDTRSKADGTFVLTNRQQLGEGPLWLQVRSSEYAPVDEKLETTWGSTDVVVKVKRTGQLTLRVTDEAQHPVSRYAVRMLQTDAHIRSSEDQRVRTQGEHEDGTATLPGLRRGHWVLLIEFAAQSGLETITHTLEVGDVAPARLDLIAHATGTRTLRVLDTAGEPIAGANVRLCDMFGKSFVENFPAMKGEQWMWNLSNLNPKVVQEGKTDDDGRLMLRGPADRALGLLIGGDGACTAHHDEVQLRVEEELLVRIDRGAGLKGRCTPPAGLAALKELGGLAADAAFDDQRRPRLRLTRTDGAQFPDRQLEYVAASMLALADDGTFAADGIPAGTWKLAVEASVSLGNGSSTSRRIPLAEVTLVSGQTADVELDLTPTIPGTLSARVLHNGVPVHDAWLSYGGDNGGASLKIEADGRCSGSVLPGTYELHLQPPYLAYPSKLVVRSGERTDVELQFFSGKVTLKLLDPDGAPLANTAVFVGDQTWQAGTTDQDGKLELVRAPGNLQLAVLPKRLCTQEAQMALWNDARQRGEKDPFTPLRIPIGEVVLQANGDQQLELRLPDTWRQ
ncbi:MAG: carboxypeptidase regulatory-like domain-containing protein [Planctomycetes bacterium]|nr:carboxypeptidase regulatory-like domain-containing protein [Planctomycetota bacterium]